MAERYQVLDASDSLAPLDPAQLAAVLAQNGQLLLPMLDLIEHAQSPSTS